MINLEKIDEGVDSWVDEARSLVLGIVDEERVDCPLYGREIDVLGNCYRKVSSEGRAFCFSKYRKNIFLEQSCPYALGLNSSDAGFVEEVVCSYSHKPL